MPSGLRRLKQLLQRRGRVFPHTLGHAVDLRFAQGFGDVLLTDDVLAIDQKNGAVDIFFRQGGIFASGKKRCAGQDDGKHFSQHHDSSHPFQLETKILSVLSSAAPGKSRRETGTHYNYCIIFVII